MTKRQLLEEMIDEAGLPAILEILSGICRIRGEAAQNRRARLAWERAAQMLDRCASCPAFRDLMG